MVLGFAFLFLSSLGSHGGLMWDEAEYANLGRDIRLGREYGSHFRPPVLPLAVAAAMADTDAPVALLQAGDRVMAVWPVREE